MGIKTTTLIAALALLAAPVAATAQTHVRYSDQQIQTQVEHALANEKIAGITVDVRDGTVTLSGTVASAWARQEAIEQAQQVHDVQGVVTTDLTIAKGESDASIADEIAKQMRRYVYYSIFDDVDIAVNEGLVTLTGSVTMPYKAAAMTELASRVQGVQDVSNKIESLPVSQSDDYLRFAIADRIYQSPGFWNYAIQVNPPIHIVVNNGRVTLTGAVRSELERRQAEVIARSTFGVFSVDNRLRIGS